MRNKNFGEVEIAKKRVSEINEKLISIEQSTTEYGNKINEIMMKIPNIIHESVPIRKR